MKKIELTAPQFVFVLASRVALAFGVGLLVSDKIPDDKRKVLASRRGVRIFNASGRTARLAESLSAEDGRLACHHGSGTALLGS